jgi:glycosyltransferase involved in cell wall biosynthesis
VNPFGIELPPVADAAAEQDGLVLFVGNFAHPPNRDAATWLAREIMPVVRARVPTARLRIVGTAPPPVVRALADEHTELVADAPDVLPHLAAAAVVAAPVRTGGGMRMKVLQAMAAGRAVVTTRRGTEGFSGFDDPPPLSVAEDAVDIAATIATLLEDEEGRRSLACRAREFCVAHYSPDAWAERLSAVYEEAAGG